MSQLQRTQIYLEQDQLQRLKSASDKKQLPMSVLIRQAIDQFLSRGNDNKDWAKDSLSKSIGKISLKSKTASVDHDRYLYGA